MFENGSGIRFEGCALRQRYPRQTISTTPIDSWLTNRSTKLFLPLIASLALWGVPVALADDGSHARHVAIALKAGETYPLAGVDRSQGFQVRFEQNPHCFAVDCAIGGQCYILATEQGSGSVQAAATGGGNTIYDVTISAVANFSKPLDPGTLPTSNTISDNAALKPANNPIALEAGPTFAPHPAIKFTQNPIVNDLPLPPETGAAARHEMPKGSIAIMAGSSRTFDFNAPLTRVAIADSAIANVEVVGPRQLMVVGYQPGSTTLTVWDQHGDYYERTVRVDHGGPQEVQLNVVVAELDRTRLEQQGVDFSVALANSGISIVGLPGSVATPYTSSVNLSATGGAGTIVPLPPTGVFPNGGSLIPLLLSPSITYGLATQNGQVTSNSFFQFLEQHDLAKILSQPRLIAESGEQAKFLSGGEIPIVIAQALNTSIVFKQFGTAVNFIPTVIDAGEIDLQVKPEVSEPDYAQGVQLFGFTVPAFITRRSETRVRMHENQTLIVAGLMLDSTRSNLRKVPYLGDVPYLGALFRHTSYQHAKSELMMTVTPEIVQPIPAGGQLAYPTQRPPMTAEDVRTKPLTQEDVTRPRFP